MFTQFRSVLISNRQDKPACSSWSANDPLVQFQPGEKTPESQFEILLQPLGFCAFKPPGNQKAQMFNSYTQLDGGRIKYILHHKTKCVQKTFQNVLKLSRNFSDFFGKFVSCLYSIFILILLIPAKTLWAKKLYVVNVNELFLPLMLHWYCDRGA